LGEATVQKSLQIVLQLIFLNTLSSFHYYKLYRWVHEEAAIIISGNMIIEENTFSEVNTNTRIKGTNLSGSAQKPDSLRFFYKN
jgi:hypothetical protein